MNSFKRMGTILSGSLLALCLMAGPAHAISFTITGILEGTDNLFGDPLETSLGNLGFDNTLTAGDELFLIEGSYDNTGFTGVGEEIFEFPGTDSNFWEVTAPTGSVITGLNSNQDVAVVEGTGNSLLIFQDGVFSSLEFVDFGDGLLFMSITIAGFDILGTNFDNLYGSLTYAEDGGNPNPVPVPAAVWLFGSALLGLVGFNRRKAAVAAA